MKNLELTDDELRFIYSYIQQARTTYGGFYHMFQDKGLTPTKDITSGLLLIVSIESKIFELEPALKEGPPPGWSEDHSTYINTGPAIIIDKDTEQSTLVIQAENNRPYCI